MFSEDLTLLSSVQSALMDRLLPKPDAEPPAKSSSAKAETLFEPENILMIVD